MSFIIKGWNEFYEGWLARLFEQPRDEAQSEGWKDGWDTADETGDARGLAIGREIQAGHIIIESAPVRPAELTP